VLKLSIEVRALNDKYVALTEKYDGLINERNKEKSLLYVFDLIKMFRYYGVQDAPKEFTIFTDEVRA